ncbi:aspartate/glutamate racemase family protein [Amphiplicatus metriothermophilus]|uniref:Aspartate racemase n=1 Tax=Amphiplicatus metriothermophilus TaxID=1519374 RepID=A0A239PXP6_9PROT|nr:amino acid racemase [Amphiplicatus metriothermophilus]MBB5519848.1 aspartate racemase [Amphiplicatus metriothermophilus]SNT75101.1 aspartate racemase [Amphiplicatus metriothermophilus]
MKTLGLIGGMSWESTAIYYRLLNEGARARLGGLHSASLLMRSFDFAQIEAMQSAGDWAAADAALVEAGRRLTQAGADALVICANTMHRCAPAIEASGAAPLIHIADATAAALKAAGVGRPALFATRYTMEEPFLRERIAEKADAEIIIPSKDHRDAIHRVIYEELCRGVVSPASKRAFLKIVEDVRKDGADGVILGCTEIGMLLKAGDIDLPLFDTAAIHVEACLDYALGGAR